MFFASREKNTAKVISSSAISKFGDMLFDYVNSVLLSGSKNGGWLLSIYQSSEVFTSVLFNFLGGALSDYKNRKNIIFICDLFSGSVCFLLSIFIPDDVFLYAVIVINIVFAIISSFRSPAYKAIFREIVNENNLGKVNSILETVNEIVQIGGPTLALMIAKFIGNRGALILDSISFFISGFLLQKLFIISPQKLNTKKTTTISQIFQGFHYLTLNRNIMVIVIFSSVINFIIAGYNLILPFSTYAFSGTKLKAYAVFLTAESVGGLVGASLSGLMKKDPSSNKLFILMMLCGLSLIPCPQLFLLTHSVIVVSVCIAMFNMFLGIYNIQFMTFVQINTKVEYIGRVFSIIFSIAILFMPFGTFFFKFVFNLKNQFDYSFLGLSLIFISLISMTVNKFIKN
ncbi:MFS transporter [Lactobacillus corticis]|uniref:MFS transporter n=1 Tax=Lactobacillus corticis TaxID=2201249 RepID=UPI002484CAFC|nr:MFS transporter [Lactobacillus corticis]